MDISISELVTSGGTFGTWPLNLPPSGAQTEVQINVPEISITRAAALRSADENCENCWNTRVTCGYHSVA
jgi:hypothetical protein